MNRKFSQPDNKLKTMYHPGTKSNACLIACAITLIIFTVPMEAVAQADGEGLTYLGTRKTEYEWQQKQDYSVSIAGRVYTPAAQVDSAELGRGEVVIVQFFSPPGKRELSMLHAHGLRAIDFISPTAMWARVEQDTSLANARLLRAAVRPAARDKIHSLLRRVMSVQPGTLEFGVQVGFFSDVRPEQQRDVLLSAGIPPHDIRLLLGGRVRLHASRKQIHLLALHPYVRRIEYSDDRMKTPHNQKTGIFVKADRARQRFGLSGRGVDIGVWDGGEIDADHVELNGRITNIQKSMENSHSTHVAGTIAATGVNPGATGMAPKARIFGYDFFQDPFTEMADAVQEYGIVISNNSWGFLTGWESNALYSTNGKPIMTWWGDELFGAYSLESEALDQLILDTGLTIVFSAGNDRDDVINADAYYDVFKEKVIVGSITGRDGPYMCIGPMASAKNVIAVGAMIDDKRITSFSSWGPTRDGRIKPEVCAPGFGLFSPIIDGYGFFSGTSMSAPTVSGSLALIVEQWRKYYKEKPSPAVLRNVLIAAARDVGPAGPDYSFGFGLINVEDSAQLVRESAKKGLLHQRSIKAGEKQVFGINVKGKVSGARICLTWLDPVGPRLVNDLDVVAISPTGKKILPWRLKPRAPEREAVRKANRRDNVEVIDIEEISELKGWKIEVSAKRLGSGESQDYVLSVWPR